MSNWPPDQNPGADSNGAGGPPDPPGQDGNQPYGQPYAPQPEQPYAPQPEQPHAPQPHQDQQYSQQPYSQQPYSQQPYASQPPHNQQYGEMYGEQGYQASPYPPSGFGGAPPPPGPGSNQFGTPPPPAGTNGLSIAALVTGILALGPIAIGLGIAGLVKTNRTGQKGKGLAIAGIILGALWIIAGSVFVILDRNSGPDYGEHRAEVAACEDGDMDACNDLYWAAPFGSPAEEIADTCGGTVPEGGRGGLCNDPEELAELTSKCEAGDMEACDDLYWSAPYGSDEEKIATTCGGLYPEGISGGDCEWEESNSGTSPGSSGTADNAELVSECEAGDMEACDDLYWSSSYGSAEEAVADTCGGTYPEGDYGGDCVEAEQIPALHNECEAGDMQACDDLWWIAPLGSDEEAFAATCGGKYTKEKSGVCTTRTD